MTAEGLHGAGGWEAALCPGPRAGAGHQQQRLHCFVVKCGNLCYAGCGQWREGPTKPHMLLSPKGICKDAIASPTSQMRKLRPREGQEAASHSFPLPLMGDGLLIP